MPGENTANCLLLQVSRSIFYSFSFSVKDRVAIRYLPLLSNVIMKKNVSYDLQCDGFLCTYYLHSEPKRTPSLPPSNLNAYLDKSPGVRSPCIILVFVSGSRKPPTLLPFFFLEVEDPPPPTGTYSYSSF